MKKEKFTFEALIHLVVHFLGVVLLFWLVVVPPLWVSLLVIVVEVGQMKLLGNCFLTVLAHKRGYMKGLSYWQYVPKLLGIKNYQWANQIISRTLELTIVGILIVRLALFV